MGGVFIKDTVVPTLTAVYQNIGGGALHLGPHLDGNASDCDALITAEKRPTPGSYSRRTPPGWAVPLCTTSIR